MAERRERKSVPRHRYNEYQNVAEHFYDAAKDSMELEYWTAAGVIIVHSAIAYADALSIKLSGTKSVGENHEDAVTLVESIVAESEGKAHGAVHRRHHRRAEISAGILAKTRRDFK